MGTSVGSSQAVKARQRITGSLTIITAMILVTTVFGIAIEYDLWHETALAYNMAFVGAWVFTIAGLSLATWFCHRHPSLKSITPYVLLLFALSIASLSFGTYIQLKYELNHLAPFIGTSALIMICTLTIIMISAPEPRPSGQSPRSA